MKLSGYNFYLNLNIWGDFQICISVPLKEAHHTLKMMGVASSSHTISFWFLSISRHFRITQENQNQLIQNRKISCNWEKKIFSQLSQKKRFLEPMEKILISLIAGETVPVTMPIALLWWSQRFIHSFFFILLQVCYW